MSNRTSASSATGRRIRYRSPVRRPRPVARGDRHNPRIDVTLRRAFTIGFVAALGVLAAIVVGSALKSISTILIYIGTALFLALALDPMVSRMQRRNISRGGAIAIVFGVFAVIVVGAIWLVVPALVRELSNFITDFPSLVARVERAEWFEQLSTQLRGVVDLEQATDALVDFARKPDNWFALAGGLFRVGSGILNGVLAVVTVLILTLYFLASLEHMKQGIARLVPRSKRVSFLEITNQITKSVGGYVNGMIVLAAINATLGLVVMLIVGVPFAGPLAFAVFALAIIPLVGSVLATVLVTGVALFNSPTTALIVLVYYLIYMQVEAYWMTPRVMSKSVSVPGSLVVIGALAGGTLLGILGALIAVPVTASILIIINKVVMPRQDLQ